MFLEHKLDTIDRRLDKIERALSEIQAKGCISTEEFDKVRGDIGRISPIAMYQPRDKCNVVGGRVP